MPKQRKNQFVVIGLGRFGGSVCKELIAHGNEVLAVDKDEQKVNEFSKIATHAVVADTTDENILRSIGVRNFDSIVVAIGDNIQASILTTLLLKELGVKNVCVKAKNFYHQRVLEKIGADKIVHPEVDMGKRVAQQMSDKNIVDYIELSDDYSIIELLAPKKLNGKSLENLSIRSKYGISIIAVKHDDSINASPKPSDMLSEGDLMVVLGLNKDIKRFEENVLNS